MHTDDATAPLGTPPSTPGGPLGIPTPGSQENPFYPQPNLPHKFIDKQNTSTPWIKHARPRRDSVPRHEELGYGQYKQHRDVALCVAANQRAHDLLSRCILDGVAIEQFVVESSALTVVLNRQSKLSREELEQLQKATHFDKKELQQWYKGAHTHTVMSITNSMA